MNRYKAVVATTNKVEELWEDGAWSRFTRKALKQLADTAKDKPILLDYDEDKRIGCIEFGSVTDSGLEIVFNLNCDIINSDCRLVPGFIVDKDWWSANGNCHRVIKETSMVSCGLVTEPLETDLPEIERL